MIKFKELVEFLKGGAYIGIELRLPGGTPTVYRGSVGNMPSELSCEIGNYPVDFVTVSNNSGRHDTARLDIYVDVPFIDGKHRKRKKKKNK